MKAEIGRPTWNGHYGWRANADEWLHLAPPSAVTSLCGYTLKQLREPTPREYEYGRGICPTCNERAYYGR